MCEVLLRVVDKVDPTDPHKDVKLTKAGHVIAVVEDGWGWSDEERTADFWRIIAIPGLSVEAASELVLTESQHRRKANPLDPKADERMHPMLQVRAWTIDFSKLPPATQDALRAPRSGSGVLTTTEARLSRAKSRVAARSNPNVLG